MIFARLVLLICTVFAANEPSYTDLNSVQARRTMEKICAKDPKTLIESEGVEWARARFALIALLRMQGKEDQALENFGECEGYCEKWGPSEEWAPLKKWGCTKDKNLKPCKKR